jgi:hypothetical protein
MSQLSTAIRNFKRTIRKKWKSVVVLPRSVLNGPIDKEFYTDEKADYSKLVTPVQPISSGHRLSSSFCTKEQLASEPFRFWTEEIREHWRLHRKLWEFCYILQVLYERRMLEPERKGLGFAVGEEPLPAVMASRGCTVLATDLSTEDPRSAAWAKTGQLASNVAKLNSRGICHEKEFKEQVCYRPVDMNHIPEDIIGFDFTWSSCSFEHCGSIDLGKRFLVEQMKCLKPGGIAVHTTEFNLSSESETIERGGTVIYRRRDVEEMIRNLRREGHYVEPILIDTGDSPEDQHIDTFPYSHELHLKLHLFEKYTSTSIGLIIQKNG